MEQLTDTVRTTQAADLVSFAGYGLALVDAVESARGYAADAKAPNTRRAYRADWQTFAGWCEARSLVALPAAADTVALYLAERADAGLKPATLGRSLTAIVQAHLARGHSSPLSPAVHAVLQGIRRRYGTAPTQKSPLGLDELRRLLDALGTRPIDVRDRALLLIGFAGALRRSELVGIDVAHLQLDRDGLRLRLVRSKTDQEGNGRIVGIPYGGRPATCPVRAVQAWQELRLVADGPVFVGLTKGGASTGKRLSGYDVARIIKRRASTVGLDATRFAGHSLRAGLVTTAVRAGKAERIIMQHTGHSSAQMLRRYVRELGVFEDNAATGIGL